MTLVRLRAVRLACIGCGAILAGCATQGVVVPGSALPASNSVSVYSGYEPIDPVSTPEIYSFDSPGKGSAKLWAGMMTETIRRNLPNQTSTTTIKKLSADGKVTYLAASATGEVGIYEVVMDYAKYRSEPVYDSGGEVVTGGSESLSDGKLLGYGKIGVGVRIRANVETLKSGVDLNGLFALGLAARQQLLRGTISVDVIGIDSPGVNALLPVGVQLDESSIQSSLQSLASIQTKIYDKEVTLTPHLIAIRRGEPLVGAVDDARDRTKATLIKRLQSLKR